MKPLVTRWTEHISDPKSKEDFEKSIRNARHVLTRLLEIVEQDEKTIASKSLTETDFTDPNWANKTAFRLGKQSYIKDIKQLLGFL